MFVEGSTCSFWLRSQLNFFYSQRQWYMQFLKHGSNLSVVSETAWTYGCSLGRRFENPRRPFPLWHGLLSTFVLWHVRRNADHLSNSSIFARCWRAPLFPRHSSLSIASVPGDAAGSVTCFVTRRIRAVVVVKPGPAYLRVVPRRDAFFPVGLVSKIYQARRSDWVVFRQHLILDARVQPWRRLHDPSSLSRTILVGKRRILVRSSRILGVLAAWVGEHHQLSLERVRIWRVLEWDRSLGSFCKLLWDCRELLVGWDDFL